ncbi:MAG: FKBP-type peptidyl-prolyl cis-trans isomerase [Prevotella sp.]|nr:FKBP-type peptidyl-prolyl cis-trans isomerase [Prevotella sp.]
MKKSFLILSLACLTALFVACSEENDTVEEYPNWQETNEKYFNSLFSEASQRIAAGDKSWKILRKWSLQDSVHANTSDYIVAHVIEQGSGTKSPLFTDSVAVIYSGRLLPSTSYPTGYVFDKSFVGDFRPETALARGFRVSGLTDGFATALQYMQCGDRWEIYVPSAMGYGTSGSSSAGIPGHSVLVFDMMLKDIIQ